MTWTDDEIDELLVRYLDRELSSDELAKFEASACQDTRIRARLDAWENLRGRLRELQQADPSSQRLGTEFASRVIHQAQSRVAELGDASVAPWIRRSELSTTVEAASRLSERDGQTESEQRVRSSRDWRFGIVLSGIAASLMAIAFWAAPMPNPSMLLTDSTVKEQSPASDRSPIEIDLKQRDVLGPTIDKLAADDAAPALPSVTSHVDDRVKEAIVSPPSDVRPDRMAANLPDVRNQLPTPFGDTLSSLAGPSLAPTAEQLRAVEEMAKNPDGKFLFVIDVSLPPEVTDLVELRRVLDRHDIAWSDQLAIDDSVQTRLVESRMIAQAGEQGLIADYVEPNAAKQTKDSGMASDQVSLIFVKARASRLDQAIIEVMQRTEEFPVFSFDLAFDPPTQALMNDLRFIQEASLPGVLEPSFQGASSLLRRSGRGVEPSEVGSRFVARERRSAGMAHATRQRSQLDVSAEMMNPIAYALFVVRHK